MRTEIIGKTLRGYELIDTIGEGGFGVVYRARQLVVGREVAIKVILPQFANSPTFVRRFEAEAQLVARLEHPHIVPMFDYWRDPDGAYLVMRYVSGGSLSARLDDGPLSLAQGVRLLDEITAALSVAHRNGVVHLDMKPDNILLDEDANFYLTDFGIAKQEGTEDNNSDGRVSGTIAYAAPEQLQSKAVTYQTDVYSLGLILYEVLTGQHPFMGQNATQMIISHLSATVPPLAEHRPGLPDGINAIIKRATDKDPEARYTDIRQIAADFRKIVEEQDRSLLTAMRGDLTTITNPYKGLRPFEEADAQTFFGREAMIERLLAHMHQSDFLAVVGPSGSGKSSLVKAGLLPQLRQGAIASSKTWYVSEMVPGSTPIRNLASALNKVATRDSGHLYETLNSYTEALALMVANLLEDKDGDLLLVIDQFEEVFTQVDSEETRRHFLDMLTYALNKDSVRLRVVITLRADFYDGPLQYEAFGKLIQENTQVVLPLSTQELERAIMGPAEQVGIKADADLVATMVADVREEPGALPLLQYALTEVFERRRDAPRLTLDAYKSSGGVSGALAKRAEEVFQELAASDRDAARQVFLRLVTLGEGEEDTRRRALYSELISVDVPARVQHVLDTFGRYRLLTFDTDPTSREPLVEVAHEALIREWHRLRDWISDSRDDVRQQRAVNRAAIEWANNGQDASFLLRGARLAQAEEWSNKTDIELAEIEQTFVAASMAERERLQRIDQERRERETALEARAQSRLRLLVSVLAVAAILSFGLSFLAINRGRSAVKARATSEFSAAVAQTQVAVAATAEREAVMERETAELQALRAQSLAIATVAQLSLLDGELDRAVALALAANNTTKPPPQAQRVLGLVAYSPGTRRLFDIGAPVDAVAMSDTGDRIATASQDGRLLLWDVDTGDLLQQFAGHTERVTSLQFVGRRSDLLVSGSWDDTAILWDVTTGEAIRTYNGHTDDVLDVAVNLGANQVATGSSDGTARVWELNTGNQLTLFDDHDGPVTAVALAPQGNLLMTGSADEQLRLWSIQTAVNVGLYSAHDGRVTAVDISADGLELLSTSEDTSARVHGTYFASATQLLEGHTDTVLDATFVRDGETVYTAGADERIIVWDSETGEARNVFEEHTGSVLSIDSDESGRFAVTGSQDGTARVWVIDAASPIRQMTGVRTGEQPVVAFNPSGNRWALGARGEGTSLYAATGTYQQQTRSLGDPFADVNGLAFNSDGSLLAVGTADREVVLLDTLSSGVRRRFTNGHTGPVTDVAITADDDLLITGSTDANVVVWNMATGDQVLRFEAAHADSITAIAASPTANIVISGSNDGSMVLWDLEEGREFLRLLGIRDAVHDLAFAPDGASVFSALGDNTVQQWNTTNGGRITRFVGHRDAVRSVAVSPNGETMLSGSDDNSLILWDVATGTPIVRFNPGYPVVSVAFHPTEPVALAAGEDGQLTLWQTISLGGMEAFVTANRYTPDLTCEQREQYNITPLCDA